MRPLTKQTIYIAILVLFSYSIQAQNVSLSTAMGYIITGNGGEGPVLHVEPIFKHTESISVGLRMEVAKIAKSSNSVRVKSRGIDFSIAPNVQYYIRKGELEYQVSFGAGIFSRGSFFSPINPNELHATQLFYGFYPRIGVCYGKFSLLTEYNIMPNLANRSSFLGNSSIMSSALSKNSYFSIKTAIRIGKA